MRKKLFVIIYLILTCSVFCQNWFPLEVGNKWQFAWRSLYEIQLGSWWYIYSFLNMEVSDSIYINNLKYYKVKGFFGFPDETPIRYDENLSQIIVYKNNIDNVYMDFSLPDSSTFLQIQPNNTLITLKIVSGQLSILGETIYVKGFYREPEVQFRNKEGWYFFSPDIGVVYQYENSEGTQVNLVSFSLIEYLLYNAANDSIYKKHQFQADVQFDPVFFIPDSTSLISNFKITHNYSILGGRSYIGNAYLDSYYYNGTDSILNQFHDIIPTTETYFSLDFPLDTNLYNQRYNLYYRIAAIDKGIIPDTFYLPESGFYKLFWRDSTTTIVNPENNAISYTLSQNYPNPFNPKTKIKFTISNFGFTTLKVYDILGREVATLVNEEKQPGVYEIEFNGSNLSSGIYFYALTAGEFKSTKKLILAK